MIFVCLGAADLGAVERRLSETYDCVKLNVFLFVSEASCRFETGQSFHNSVILRKPKLCINLFVMSSISTMGTRSNKTIMNYLDSQSGLLQAGLSARKSGTAALQSRIYPALSHQSQIWTELRC